jgi:hypothetical protein
MLPSANGLGMRSSSVDDDRRDNQRELHALSSEQQLTIEPSDLEVVLGLHAGHLRQARQLREGVNLLDEPATVFAPARGAGGTDARS